MHIHTLVNDQSDFIDASAAQSLAEATQAFLDFAQWLM
ncbi:hypothetical protein SCAZ3_07235 [Streptococcus canis FSL Z3-227]|uniref:Uncharacterized protein n=1 Tax=Streptococcus canis FSL Z3-227 TaxID=482234 RepID=A0AAV3FSU2_STRCB|nr:hypothetical protein SCAZ3_07235 [Streptococcus canis FSL Z3-227]